MVELFRTLTLGDALGVGSLLALVWLVARLEWTRSDAAAAHRAIAKRLDDLTVQVQRTAAQVQKAAEDVAYLRGRQDERDRATSPSEAR